MPITFLDEEEEIGTGITFLDDQESSLPAKLPSKEILNVPNIDNSDEELHAKYVLQEYYKNKTGKDVPDDDVQYFVQGEFGEGTTFKTALTELQNTHSIESKGTPKPLETGEFAMVPDGKGGTVAVKDAKAHYEKLYADYGNRLLDFGTNLSEENAQIRRNILNQKRNIPKPFDGEPEGARVFREQAQQQYQEALKNAPQDVRLSIEKTNLKERYDYIARLWAGKDKTQMPERLKNEVADIEERIGLTDSGFEKRVQSGRATTELDLALYSQYSTHNNQQTALAFNYGDKEQAMRLIGKMNEMEAAATGSLPNAESVVGKIRQGTLAAAVPMGESIALAAASGGTLDKAYWALQGQGEVIRQYVNSSGVDLTEMSDAEYARVMAISASVGAVYAGIEYIGGAYNLQKGNLLKKAFGKLTAKAVSDPTLSKKLMRGGVRFAVEWLAENSEEGFQGLVLELGKQGLSKDMDIAEVVQVGFDNFKEAAPATFGLAVVGGGVSTLSNVRKQQRTVSLLTSEGMSEDRAKQTAKKIAQAKTQEEVDSIVKASVLDAKTSAAILTEATGEDNNLAEAVMDGYTMEDVSFIRDTMTDEEIDALVLDMEPQYRELAREVFKAPSEEGVIQLNDQIDFDTEIGGQDALQVSETAQVPVREQAVSGEEVRQAQPEEGAQESQEEANARASKLQKARALAEVDGARNENGERLSKSDDYQEIQEMIDEALASNTREEFERKLKNIRDAFPELGTLGFNQAMRFSWEYGHGERNAETKQDQRARESEEASVATADAKTAFSNIEGGSSVVDELLGMEDNDTAFARFKELAKTLQIGQSEWNAIEKARNARKKAGVFTKGGQDALQVSETAQVPIREQAQGGEEIRQTQRPQTQKITITEPPTVGELRTLVQGLGGPKAFMEVSEDKERAKLVLQAIAGNPEALTQLQQEIVGAEQEQVVEEEKPVVQTDMAGNPIEEVPLEEVPASVLETSTLLDLSKRAQAALRAGEKVKGVFRPLVNLTTRINEISPQVGRAVRGVKQQTHLLVSERTQQAQEFAQSFKQITKGMPQAEQDVVISEVLNGNWEALKARGISGIESLQQMYETVAAELGVDAKENYYRRQVRDLDGLSEYLGQNPRGDFKRAIDKAAKERGRSLTADEKAAVVRQVLKKKGDGGLVQARTIEEVTPEMAKFYENPLVSLNRYIQRSSQIAARNKMLGIKENLEGEFDETNERILDDDIATIISSLVEGDLTAAQDRELKSLLQSELEQRGSPAFVRNIHKLASLKYVTKLKTVVKQMGDLGVAVGENGIASVIGAEEASAWKDEFGNNVKLSLETIGINALDAEIQEDKRRQIEEFVFKPLEIADRFGKETLLKSTAKSWHDQSKTDPVALKKKLMGKFNDPVFVDKIIGDMQNDLMSGDVSFALYSQMADFHPISHAEHIKFYIDHPVARPVFILKSFAFKRFDRMYREAFAPMVDGISKSVAGHIDNNQSLKTEGADDFARGAVGMGRFLIFSIGTEALINKLYKEVMQALGFAPEEIPEDESWTAMYLQELSGLLPMIDPYDLKDALRRQDPGVYWEKAIDIPEPLGFDSAKSLFKHLAGKDDYSWKKDVPWLGEFLYGAEREAHEKELMRRRKAEKKKGLFGKKKKTIPNL